MIGVPGSSERPEAIASGTEKVRRACYADGYAQGRFGRRICGRVEWEPRVPRLTETPELLAVWWDGHRAGVKARVEIDHAQEEVASRPPADGPVGAQGVLAPGRATQGGAVGARREDGRGGDAGSLRGVVRGGSSGRDEAGSGVPVDPRLMRVGAMR
jgi:hypothetical protein